MKRTVVQRACWTGARLGVFVGALWILPSFASAYTTTSPEVLGLIQRAMPFLENAKHSEPGGWAVIGLALIKNKVPADHPKVVEAVTNIRAKVASSSDPAKLDIDIYSNGLCIIFLATLDPEVHANEIRALMRSLMAKQKPHGGWGYPYSENGDTSMTQYGVLSTWEAKQVGFQMPLRTIEAVTDWLIRSQDPSGAWGYQGKASPTYQLIKQEGVRHSMTAAGLGSTYICADLLGLTPEVTVRDEDQPAALLELKSSETPGKKRERIQTSIDSGRLRKAQEQGNAWIQANFRIPQPEHTLYYMYALERYCSFRELAEGKANYDPAKREGPAWYNAGVEYLQKTQAKDGTWDTGCDKEVDTGFGVLFLLRSTQKSIQRARGYGEGLMVGGRGLSKEGALAVEGGRVVTKSTKTPFEALRAALDRDDADADALAAAAERIGQLAPKDSQLLVSSYRKKLTALLNNPDPDQRIAAVKMLGHSGDLDNVPLLILALEDANLDVVATARDGLCRLSRKLDGFGPPDEPSDLERTQAIEAWRNWYLSIRPDAEF